MSVRSQLFLALPFVLLTATSLSAPRSALAQPEPAPGEPQPAPAPTEQPPTTPAPAADAEPPTPPAPAEAPSSAPSTLPVAPDPLPVPPVPAAEAPAAAVPSPAPEPAPPEPAPEPPATHEEVDPKAATPPLSVTGSFFTRYELRDGYADIGANVRQFDTDGVAYRARLGLETAPLELGDGLSSYVYFEPQAADFITTSGALVDAELGLHQGTLNLVASSYHLQIGRFEMVYGEHLVIGNVIWHETGRAFDGARLHVQPEADSAWGDLFMTLVDEGADALSDRAIGAADHYFAGTYLGLGPAIGDIELDAYLLSRIWLGGTVTTDELMMTTASVDPAAELTIGSRLKGAAGPLDYRAEGGLQVGARKPGATAAPTDVFAFQIDGEFGVTPMTGLRLAAHGWFASGDDDPADDTDHAWNQLYPTAHKFMGLSDIMGARSNIAGGSLIVHYAFSPSVKLGIDAQLFLRPENTPAGNRGYAGAEVDTGLVYVIGPGLTARGMYALFVPDQDIFGGDEPAHFLELEIAQAIQ